MTSLDRSVAEPSLAGSSPDEYSLAETEHWNYAVESPFRPAYELLAPIGEATADRQTGEPDGWTGTGDQLLFRDAVLRAHLARSRARKGEPTRDLRPDELATVAGTDVRMRRDAAAAAGRMLAAANAALAAAQAAGDQDARRTIRVGAASGYRGRAHQETLWHRYFPRYYHETRQARALLPGGPYGPAAVRHLIEEYGIPRRIAAPGYSNHQNGIAIDILQRRQPGHRIQNSTAAAAVRAWRSTWLHGWLRQNAGSFGFHPYEREPWHWNFRRAPAEGQESWATRRTDDTPEMVTNAV
jgi:LAS superfamily LD-carboxypeptidase LdcB